MSTNSNLDALFTDSEPLDLESIIQVLKEFVRVKRDNKDIFFTEAGNKTSVPKRILLFALTRKLLKSEGHIENDTFSAKETSKELQTPKGSIDSAFNWLRGKGYILGSGTDYLIPNYKIGEILTILKEKKNG